MAEEYGLSKRGETIILNWFKKIKALGESAFEETITNRAYSKELKFKVIKTYQNGEWAFGYLANIHNIRCDEIVRK